MMTNPKEAWEFWQERREDCETALEYALRQMGKLAIEGQEELDIDIFPSNDN